jgi:hypothetical protein
MSSPLGRLTLAGRILALSLLEETQRLCLVSRAVSVPQRFESELVYAARAAAFF